MVFDFWAENMEMAMIQKLVRFCITRYLSRWGNEINEYVMSAVKNIHYPVHSQYLVKNVSR